MNDRCDFRPAFAVFDQMTLTMRITWLQPGAQADMDHLEGGGFFRDIP